MISYTWDSFVSLFGFLPRAVRGRLCPPLFFIPASPYKPFYLYNESVTQGDNIFAEKFAKKLGYPIVTKPLNGGGGRGIQVFNDDQEVQKLINTGEKAFYNEKTLVEKYIFPASHVEVQMVADKYGNVLCLGERDCSIQEKKQKLIEESPCAKINDSQRKELFKKCTNLLKKIGYIGCGTMEFLLDSNGIFYFMEMN